VAINIKTNYY